MSAATNSPTEPINPDPPRDAPATLTRLSRVLNVVRRLIGIGQQLLATVHERTAAPDFRSFAKPFGTADIALIIARITRGLRRAAALEAMLCERAQRGRDLTQPAFRDPATPAPHAETERAPPDPQPETRPRPAPDPRLANLPTEAEIAADIRRRPIGVVIVSICEDLGTMPGHLDRAFWDELRHAILCYGGSLAAFIGRLSNKLFPITKEARANPTSFQWPEPPTDPPLAPATGPP